MRRPQISLTFAIMARAIAVTLPSFAHAVTAPKEDAVWDWDARCSSPKQIRLKVTVGGNMIYTAKFGICHLSDYSQPMNPQRILVFRIAGPHKSLFGEPQKEALEGNIWEAGRDPNDILLGVSFAGPKRVWCNAIHVLDPNKPSETVLARGLIVRTDPI